MLKFNLALLLLFSLFSNSNHVSGQSTYAIKLDEPAKKIIPKQYYFQSIIDKRKNPGNNGKILSSSGKLLDVVFSPATDSMLFDFSGKTISRDTNLIPIQLVIEKLHFTDEGSIGKHVLSLNIKLSMLRILEGKEFTLYGTSGTPSYNSRGVTRGLAEKLLQQAIESFLSGFDEYANSNYDQQAFCKGTEASIVYDTSYTDYENADTIRWKSNYKLTWDDFKGKPDQSSGYSALSNCMFSYKAAAEYKDGIMKLSLFVYPCFTKKASWVVQKNKQEGLLTHEQLHFDICELYMRMLRKNILNISLSILNHDDQIKKLFDESWQQYQEAQARYDDETQHGLIEEMQKNWAEKVESELKTLEEFTTL